MNSKESRINDGFRQKSELISSPEGIISVLRNACRCIDNISGTAEKEFLNIGSVLQKYYFTSKEIITHSSAAVEAVSGEVIAESIDELNQMFVRTSTYLAKAEQEIEQGENILCAIEEILVRVAEEITGFKKIVKHLRMLGISTRIESARLGSDDNGFNTLAGNVEKLSTVINDKAGNIKDHANYLIKIIKEATSRIIRLENKQRQQAAKILDETRAGLRSLTGKYESSAAKTQAIAANSESISRSIGEVVTSIQFHDITRQQMEHVKEAFENLEEKIFDFNNGQHKDEAKEQVLINLMHDTCLLQSMQFLHSKEELVRAVR
ncbi:MAG: methyl-accepting chemotaxis protein, partial [Methanococcaceae archaeon]